MTTVPPPEAFPPAHRNVSSPNLTTKTRKGSAIEESLRTYQLLEALQTSDTESLQNLLSTYQATQAPLNDNSLNPSGSTRHSSSSVAPSPLILAVQCTTTPTVEFVLTHLPVGVDINQHDQYGNTALHYAAKAGRMDVVEMLLKQKNINDTLLNNEGKQAFDLAKTPEIAEILKADCARFAETITALFRKRVAESNFQAVYNLFQDPRAAALIDINYQDSNAGTTLLHSAAKKKDLEMVQFCLEHGADVNIRDRKGKLPIDVTKDDEIKTLLREAGPIDSLVVTTSSNQSPKLKGYLHKWTNYAGGYKTRWFVLEDGILSYFKNKDDAGNSCRGSINMKIAKVTLDSTERQRFDIIGKGSVRYHLRANNPSEAKRWILALQQSMQWIKARRMSAFEDSNAPTVQNAEEDSRSSRSRSNTVSSNNRERSRSPSDDSIEIDNVPYPDSYPMTISSAKAQLDMQTQLLESLLAILPPSTSLESHQAEVMEAFKKSLGNLQQSMDDLIRMSEDRDVYWQRKLEKELETKRLWEESMRGFAIDQAQMEQIIQENIQKNLQERKRMKKLSKIFNADGQQTTSVTTSPLADKAGLITTTHLTGTSSDESLQQATNTAVAADTANSVSTPTSPTTPMDETKQTRAKNSTISLTTDAYRSDDEFFDAMDGAEDVDVEEAVMDSPFLETESCSAVQPYVTSSYAGYPDHLRTRLPLDQKSLRPEVSLWSILKNSIGKDLSKITLPVYFNEPTSMLQRMAEDMEYSELLDIAARQKGSTERILYVAAFAMSNYSSTVGRIAKPFNPLLDETYEYVRPDKLFRYVSEQVSHHPPISACYGESPNYDFFSEVDVKSKFWGKSFEILPKGVSHVNLKVPNEHWPRNKQRAPPEKYEAIGNPNAFSEHYSWKKVTTCVNNLIVGSPWIDHYGDMSITNHLTGDKCILTFKARGWRGKDAFEIHGVVKDAEGNEIWEIAGRWNERLIARRSDGGRYAPGNEQDLSSDAAAASATVLNEPISNAILSPATNTPRRPILLLWKRATLSDEPMPFNLTQFAMTLNDLPESLVNCVAPTDSRMRPDQRAMENGQYDLASTEKVRLEEKQRAKRKARERGDIDDHKPRWFTRDTEPDTNEGYWKFNHEYWKERELVYKEKIEGTGPGKWNIEDDDIF